MATATSEQRRTRRWALRSWLMALVLAMLSAAPAHAEHPTQFMQRVANELIAAQRAGGGTSFASVLRRHADVPWLGLSSLGSYAKVLPAPERPTYYNGMIRFISNYAAKESEKYLVARATVVGATEETANGVYVDSVVELRSGDKYDVRWYLGRQGTTYKVRDAQAVGFWMSPFLKKLFENYIAENGGNPKALVLALNR